MDKLEEQALLTIGGLVLMQECELPVLECFEEFVPGDFFQLGVRLGEVDAEYALPIASFSVLHLGRTAAALFDPATDNIMVCRSLRLSHYSSSCIAESVRAYCALTDQREASCDK